MPIQADPLSVLLSYNVGLYTSPSLSDHILIMMAMSLEPARSPSNSTHEKRAAILNDVAR
jgi:hypothetical protein